MQLSPLTDLFFASAPPAAAGPGLDPSAAPFAQWLSAQLQSAAPLADPATPPPFSQFPLNWGFPVNSTLVAEPAAAPSGPEVLVAGEVAGEALPAEALEEGEVKPGAAAAPDRLKPNFPEPPVVTLGTRALVAGEVAGQALPAEVLSALPKPATSPLAFLAGGEAKPGGHSANASLKPIPSEPPGLETRLPGPLPVPIVVAAVDSPLSLEPVLAATNAPPPQTADPAVTASRPRREQPLDDAPAAETTAPLSSLEALTHAAPAVIPTDNSTQVAMAAKPSRLSGSARVEAKIDLPVTAAPTFRPGSVQPPPKQQEPAAAITPAAPEAKIAAPGPQPAALPLSKEAPPLAEYVARGNQQRPFVPAAPSTGLPLDPALVAEAQQAAVDVVSPVITARPGQAVNLDPQRMPGHHPQPPMSGFEPSPVLSSGKPDTAPVQPAQPSWARPLEQAVRVPMAEPAPAAAVQGVGPKLVPAAPEASGVGTPASVANPQSLAAAATLAAVQIAPVAGNIAATPRPVAGFRPLQAWASADSIKAETSAPGLAVAAEAGFNPTLDRPLPSAAAGQQSGERSLSDQRFASLFGQVSPQVQVTQADSAIPSQAAVAPAAGFESLLQQPRETSGALPLPDSTVSPLMAAPLGQPSASVASTPPAGPFLTLPSGQQVPEQEVLQQVFHQLPSRASGPQRVTLRLNPEELGEVRLEMIIDKETVRAHLQAQSQQVQEVLEKHLPRLREAFEQQGLKLQELQVSVDSGRDGGRSFFSQSQHQQPAPSFAGSGNARRHQGEAVTEAVVPPPSPRSSGGLSLRV